MKLAEWQKNKPECTSPFKASHPSVSADIPLARTDHTVEPSTEIRQGLLPCKGGLCSYVTVGETTGKGKETGGHHGNLLHTPALTPTPACAVSAVLNLQPSLAFAILHMCEFCLILLHLLTSLSATPGHIHFGSQSCCSPSS